MVLEGLEQGICFHDLCAVACGKDAITHNGAYGVSFKNLETLTVLQAIKQYHRSASGGSELRVKQWAESQLQAHSDLQKEYTTDMAAWNAKQASQLRAAEVAAALHNAAQDVNAAAGSRGTEEDQDPVETEEDQDPEESQLEPVPDPPSPLLTLIPIMNEVDEGNAQLHSQPEWFKQPVNHVNTDIGFPTILRFTPPSGFVASGQSTNFPCVPPLGPTAADLNCVLHTCVYPFGSPLVICPLKLGIPKKSECPSHAKPGTPESTPDEQEQPDKGAHATSLLVASERQQLTAIAGSSVPALVSADSTWLGRHAIAPNGIIKPSSTGFNPLAKIISWSETRLPPSLQTDAQGGVLDIHTFLHTKPAKGNERSWDEWH